MLADRLSRASEETGLRRRPYAEAARMRLYAAIGQTLRVFHPRCTPPGRQALAAAVGGGGDLMASASAAAQAGPRALHRPRQARRRSWPER